MTGAFYITLWVSILILLIINVIYTFFAYNTMGAFEDLNNNNRLLQARNLLLWALILFSIALAVVIIFAIGAFAFGWESVYERGGFVAILHVLFFLWILAAVILLVIASERLGGSSNLLSSVDLQRSKRDIGVGLIGSSAILILLAGSYLGYSYREERKRYYCRQMVTLNKLKNLP